MSDYTPTTAGVRELHAFAVQLKFVGRTFGSGLEEFDRWIAAHDAEVLAAGDRKTEPEIVHLMAEGSLITVCCKRHALDERVRQGTFDPEYATCPGVTS